MSDFSLPRPRPAPTSPFMKALATQRDVLWALILHDIKSRFFGNGLGYVVTILWPATHIAVVVLAFVLSRRPVPYGSSSLLYASTGAITYIAWNYMSRFTMMGMIQNASFRAYPVVRTLDMIFARMVLESISIFIITVGLLCVNALCQVDIVPVDITQAVFGLLSAVLLGVGFGMFNSAIAMVFPMWALGSVLIIILFWITSGMTFNPESLPSQFGYYVSWNPLMHSTEWIRLAYYADFPAHLLSKSYVIFFGLGMFAAGLMLQVVLKRYLR